MVLTNTWQDLDYKLFTYNGKTVKVFRDGEIHSKRGRLKPMNNGKGYMSVCISKKSIYIHRIVAQTWVENPMNKPCVNHKNGVKADNSVDNLEWCTYSENLKHSFDSLGRKFTTQRRDIFGFKHAQAKAVKQIDMKTGKVIEIHGSIKQAAKKLNALDCGIGHALKGRNKSYYGYKWEYA